MFHAGAKTREKKATQRERERKESTGPSQKTNQPTNKKFFFLRFLFFCLVRTRTHCAVTSLQFFSSFVLYLRIKAHTHGLELYIYINNAQKDDSECEICEEQREEERDVLFLVCVAVVRGLFSLSGFCFGER